MSSILSGFDSSNIAKDQLLFDLESTYELGDLIPARIAEKVIDRADKNFRKGDFVLVYVAEKGNYIYAVFEGDMEGEGLLYDIGDGQLTSVERDDLFKLKSDQQSKRKIKHKHSKKNPKSDETVSWSDKKNIRIIKNAKGRPHIDLIHDHKMPTEKSSFKYLLKHKAIGMDTAKFIKVGIIREIVKHHKIFTHELALTALRIRVLHDDELIDEFDKAINELEVAIDLHNNETDEKAKDHTYEKCQNNSTTLKLFLNEIVRRGLESHIN